MQKLKHRKDSERFFSLKYCNCSLIEDSEAFGKNKSKHFPIHFISIEIPYGNPKPTTDSYELLSIGINYEAIRNWNDIHAQATVIYLCNSILFIWLRIYYMQVAYNPIIFKAIIRHKVTLLTNIEFRYHRKLLLIRSTMPNPKLLYRTEYLIFRRRLRWGRMQCSSTFNFTQKWSDKHNKSERII